MRKVAQLKAQEKQIAPESVSGFYKDKIDHCQLVNDILYYVSYDGKFGSTPFGRILVPTSLQDTFLDKSHGDYQSGHPGEKQMRDKLIKFCIWPRMAQSISQKVRRCYQCQALRPNPYRKMVPVIPQKSQFPLQFVQADLQEFYPPSRA